MPVEVVALMLTKILQTEMSQYVA